MIPRPESRYPFRAKRVSRPFNLIIANNRGTFTGRPGIYRLQAVALDEVAQQLAGSRHRMFFCVTSIRDVIDAFPLGVTVLTAVGEYLPVDQTIEVQIPDIQYAVHLAGYPVEVELHEDEVIHFWDEVTNSRVKIVQVDELVSHEPTETEGRRG